ncbi:lipopolysaccharide assembly LapA domain-containing protein [Paenibacillus sp. GCM10023252]|uniref:LapA family protein n=1 Tax=Paenibacillus sp. GCM10023252 TaxID=3252649 RepID=UPI00361F259E
MRAQGVLIAALLFAFITAGFAVINVDSVQVNFLFAKTQSPLILIILASVLLGGLTVGLFGVIRQYRLQRTIRGLEKQVAKLKAEADSRLGAGAGVHVPVKTEPNAAASEATE